MNFRTGGNGKILPKQAFARLEAAIAAINARSPHAQVELPLPASQAKWGDVGNDWYVEWNLEKWDFVVFNDERWVEYSRDTYPDDDALMYRLFSRAIDPSASRERRIEILTEISPDWGERAERELKKPGR